MLTCLSSYAAERFQVVKGHLITNLFGTDSLLAGARSFQPNQRPAQSGHTIRGRYKHRAERKRLSHDDEKTNRKHAADNRHEVGYERVYGLELHLFV